MSQDTSSGEFYAHISVSHKSLYLEDQRDALLSSLYLFYCQVTLHVSAKLVHQLFLIGFYHYISKFMTCASGCNYSLCTPDDGCGRHPKHVE